MDNNTRRCTTTTKVGNIEIGGNNPIRLQSMANVSTNDTEAAVAQILSLAKAGAELVRLTTQGVREAENMAEIKNRVQQANCNIPLVADVHFNPKAAYVAATTCDKVRINPGNFVDAARTFRKLTYTDQEYESEIQRIRRALIPFLNLCKEHNTAIRLGVNHGSLSDRIMSRYGDTPAGMVESVMEFLRICIEEHFLNIVISVKASNTVIMVKTMQLLVKAMDAEEMHFPLHLGVTEAGDGEQGRIKSAVGIGALLSEGIGDTIRVSLSEAPENELPVARMLVEHIAKRGLSRHIDCKETTPDILPNNLPKYAVIGYDIEKAPDNWHFIDASQPIRQFDDNLPIVLTSENQNTVSEMQDWMLKMNRTGQLNPIILHLKYETHSIEELQVMAGADFGTMLLNGFGSGIFLEARNIDTDIVNETALGILQATRLRISRTDYIACPGCGRTLFNLEETLQQIKAATSHLTGLKIGVMGCIVNGPGEMADADYGYVGAAKGCISLYRNKECVRKNIPQTDAIPMLIDILKSDGVWKEP